MDNVNIESSTTKPGIIMDAVSGICEIAGVSMPEDVRLVYSPVFKWLEDFKDSEMSALTFNFRLVYFNTASAKIILDILTFLDNTSKQGKTITINWYYKENDLDMEEAADDYEDMISLPVNKIKLQLTS